MKSERAGLKWQIVPSPLRDWVRGATARLLTRDGAPSIDGLDAAIRGFGVALVLLLSALGFGRPQVPTGLDLASPLLVAGLLVAYNVVVITLAGVPWRTAPGFPLFVLDWSVASAAILVTGGLYSPFNILYYALVIGAALRVGLGRSSALVLGCGAIYALLTLLQPQPDASVRLPALIVQIASLFMVMFMSAGMKRAVEVEVRKVELEEQAAGQLRLLNNLTNTVLSGSPDLERVLRSVAAVSSEALHADSGVAVLYRPGLGEFAGDECLPGDEAPLVVADRGPNPTSLSPAEERVLQRVLQTQRPDLIRRPGAAAGGAPGTPAFYPALEHGDRRAYAIACVPFLLQGRAIGALFVARYDERPFAPAEVSLLTAVSQQMAVAVRLARLYDMEREKAVRSEERERLERDLLSMVSHELRTPLTAIKTSVSALSETSPGVKAENAHTRLLGNIERSTDRLIGLVNELLDMARLRAGRVSLNLQHLNMGDLLVDVAAQFSPLAEAKGQTLHLDLPLRGTVRWVKLGTLADRRRIEQVVLNLLSNANKYSPGGTRIIVGATPREGQVRVFVRDQGPGIPGSEQGMLFDKFYQASTATQAAGLPRPESSGLGLAIARSIIDLHGGEIGVLSRVGSGSTFYFLLSQDGAEGATNVSVATPLHVADGD